MAWFNYNGGSPTNPASYSPATSEPSCQEGAQLCAINASGTSQPSLTPALISEMLDAVVLQESRPNVKLKD